MGVGRTISHEFTNCGGGSFFVAFIAQIWDDISAQKEIKSEAQAEATEVVAKCELTDESR